MMNTNKQMLAAVLATLAAPVLTSAAPVSWQTAFEVDQKADIRVDGRAVVYAVNGGDNNGYTPNETPSAGSPLNVTVGGQPIAFEGLGGLYGPTSTFLDITFGDLVDHLPNANTNVTFGVSNTRNGTAKVANVSYAPTTGTPVYMPTVDSDLDTLLNSMVWADGRATSGNVTALNIVLNNLSVGTAYQVQLIGAADSRSPRAGTIERSLNTAAVNDGLGNSVNNLSAYQDVDGDGQFHVTSVLGTFTADGTSQALNVVLTNGRNPGISALLLTTAVPEPTTIGAAIMAAGVMALRRRSR